MKSAQTNESLYNTLCRHVAETYFSDVRSQTAIDRGPLQLNYFSATFWMDLKGQEGRRGVYVKIPKIILYAKACETITPLNDDDRILGENEYRSLLHLSRFWRNDALNVRFVKPLEFIKEYNAIVTERFYARHLFKTFRRCDLKGRLRKRHDAVHPVMARLGEALAGFHQTSIRECVFDAEATLTKMRTYCSYLKSFGVARKFIDTLVARLGTLRNLDVQTHRAHTLKGFEVRQVFVDRDDVVFILDPGKLKFDYKESDLARFIASCRILYWGSPLFGLRLSPDRSYEQGFLGGYYGNVSRDSRVLCLMTAKELLKHWKMAHVIVGLKDWPAMVKTIVRNTYIDPFYTRQISAELAQIEA